MTIIPISSLPIQHNELLESENKLKHLTDEISNESKQVFFKNIIFISFNLNNLF